MAKNTTESSYIDDVCRTFYVYLHKDKKTKTPFYVGKGTGNRAYDTDGRNCDWHQKVKELNEEYNIKIVKDNLSESEAWELEAELIKKYGRKWTNEGPLVNLTEGGDIFTGDTLSISVEINVDDGNMRGFHEKYLESKLEGFSELSKEEKEYLIDKWIERLKEPTNFKNLTIEEQKDFIKLIKPKINEFIIRYKELGGKIDRGEGETYLEGSINDLLTTVKKTISLYNKRRISFRELATYLEKSHDYLEDDVEGPDEKDNEEIITLGQDILSFFNSALDSIINGDGKQKDRR